MIDSKVAAQIASAIQGLAGDDSKEPPSAARLLKLMPHAATRLRCRDVDVTEQLRVLHSHLRPLLRRSLAMAASAYVESLVPRPVKNAALEAELREMGLDRYAGGSAHFDLHSSVLLAEAILANSPAGLRSMAVLGNAAPLAAALARLSGQTVILVPWMDAPLEDAGTPPELTIPGVRVESAMQPGAELPFWLKGRFQSVFVMTPLDPVSSYKSISMGMAALDSAPGRRLYWTGHPGRQRGYFALYSLLAKHGMFLDRLIHDVGRREMDPEFAHELFREAPDAPEAADWLDAGVLESLLSAGIEYDHLHVYQPMNEAVIHGRRLELVPVLERDIPLYDSWLTPEFCREVGLDDVEPRPTVEELKVKNWYPGHEWWMFRTVEGARIGIVNLVLHDFWWTRSMPFDIGVADKTHRGHGLLNEAVRLSFARVFQHLDAQSLWSIVAVANVRICRGHRSNFFRVVQTVTDPATGEDHEYIEISIEDYLERLRTGDVDVPVPT